ATVINSQIKTSSVAYRNVNDAISMMQTAEGAMQEAGSMLMRIKELVTQGSNDSMSKDQYYFLVQEMSQLMGELANTAGRTSFNGNNLLGNFSTTGSVAIGTLAVSGLPSSGRTGPWTFMTGSGIGDKVTVELNNKGYVDGALKVGALNALYTRVAWLADPANSPKSGEGFKAFALAPGTSESATMLKQKVYGDVGGLALQTSLTVASGGTGLVAGRYLDVPLSKSVNGVQVDTGALGTIVVDASGAITSAVISKSGSDLGLSVTVSSAGSNLPNGTFKNVPLTQTVNGQQIETGALAEVTVTGGTVRSVKVTRPIQGFSTTSYSSLSFDARKYLGATGSFTGSLTVGPNSLGDDLQIDAAKLFGVPGGTITLRYTADKLEASGLVDARNKSLNELIDDSLMQINSHRSYFGAFYGRFEHNIANLSAQTENLSAALSRVQDADYGAETAT
ncbi:MAG: hypothetical protein EB072_19550, partial [Betaproteobacteria bacterium]|nr:hypothetical protein [Betaproteobacteria bacterium]